MNSKKSVLCLILVWLTGVLYEIRLRLFRKPSVYEVIVYNVSAGVLAFLTGILYAKIYFSLRRQAKVIAQQNSTSVENRSQAKRVLKEKQFLNTIIFIGAIATITIIIPIVIYKQVQLCLGRNFINNKVAQRGVNFFFYTMYHVNFPVNPYLYFYRLPVYRKTFHQLYCKCTLWNLHSWLGTRLAFGTFSSKSEHWRPFLESTRAFSVPIVNLINHNSSRNHAYRYTTWWIKIDSRRKMNININRRNTPPIYCRRRHNKRVPFTIPIG